MKKDTKLILIVLAGILAIVLKFLNYAGFCAAVTKRVFGSTSQAKKVLARTRKETSK